MRIYLAIDRFGGPFHRIAKHIQHFAEIRGHETAIITDKDEPFLLPPDLLIAVWYGSVHWENYLPVNKWVMFYDYFTWKDNPEWNSVVFNRSHQASRRFASNTHLAAALRNISRLEYEIATDGVDQEMFKPTERSEIPSIPRIGWVGNSNLGGGIKRKDLVERVCEEIGYDFVCADPADNPVRFEDMPAFYNSLDALVIATDPSIGEGTPNPALEAAACGIPVFSTPVGIVPTLAKDTELVQLWETEAELKTLLIRPSNTPKFHDLSKWTWEERLKDLVEPLGPIAWRPRLLIVYDSPGWCLDHISQYLEKEFPEYDISRAGYADKHPAEGYDVHFVIALTYAALPRIVSYIPCEAKYITCQFDEICWKRDKQVFAAFEMSRLYSHGWLFANEGMKKRMMADFDFSHLVVGTCQDGVDTNMFRPQPYREDFDDMETPLRVLWVGNSDTTFFGDLKGYELIRTAVRETENVILLTADKHSKTRCPHEEMPDRYRECDVVICASSVEGTPNSVLEGLASGRMIISTRVGITEEIQDGIYFVDRTVDSIKNALQICNDNRHRLPMIAAQGMNVVQNQWTWEIAAKRYKDVLNRVRNAYDTKVFLIHCGEPTVEATREALQASEGYGSEWEVEEIENVAPMDAAFNEMLDRANRQFHVQVDADMVLKPGAINTLRSLIRPTLSDVAFVCLPLWDNLFHRTISGIKIYRSDLVKRYRYEPTRHCEVSQYEKIQADGFRFTQLLGYPEEFDHDYVLGIHSVDSIRVAYWNCYDRSMRARWLERQERLNWFYWLNPYYIKFVEWFNETGDNRYLWGFLGLLMGQAEEIPEDWGEKDYRKFPESFNKLFDLFTNGEIQCQTQNITRLETSPKSSV